MKLFFFGGAEEGDAAKELKMIEWVIQSLAPKQLLHIPFARPNGSSWAEWDGDRFHRNIDIPDMEYLNADHPEHISKAHNPLIFISGWSDPINLIDKIISNPALLKLIHNAYAIIGESAGVKVLGTHYIVKNTDNSYTALPSLWLVPQTVFEWHYTQRNKQGALERAMKETQAIYGIGIDSCTAMIWEIDTFPEKYSKIGHGNIVIKQQSSMLS